MDHGPDEQPTSAQLLTRLFEVERRFLRSDSGTADLLITAFDPDVVIHEPASLPYPGDWCDWRASPPCSAPCARPGATSGSRICAPPATATPSSWPARCT